MKTTYIEVRDRFFKVWYDRETRSWWAAEFDGDSPTEAKQVGDAIFAATRDRVLIYIGSMIWEKNLPILTGEDRT